MISGTALAGAEESILRATKTHLDGTKEDLGIIAYWHKNPLKILRWKIRKLLFGKVFA